jgi:hypothetical protein
MCELSKLLCPQTPPEAIRFEEANFGEKAFEAGNFGELYRHLFRVPQSQLTALKRDDLPAPDRTMNPAGRAVPYDDCEAEGALAWTCVSGSFIQ